MKHANATQGHILLVDDDPGITKNLPPILEKEGFFVTVAHDGEEAEDLIKTTRPDLVLLDIDLPKKDGLLVLIDMRRDEDLTPVNLLTRFGDVAHRIVGLRLGADDYIGKPFSGDEVVERIKAVLRRTRAGKPSLARSSRLRCRELVFDRRLKRAYLQSRDLKLKSKESALLECLMLHPDEVVSRNRMLDDLGWDDPRLIDRHMSPLRKALGDDPKSPTFIETVHSEGYRFFGPVEGEE
jgi:DNA-binding response OmpR family regulator